MSSSLSVAEIDFSLCDIPISIVVHLSTGSVSYFPSNLLLCISLLTGTSALCSCEQQREHTALITILQETTSSQQRVKTQGAREAEAWLVVVVVVAVVVVLVKAVVAAVLTKGMGNRHAVSAVVPPPTALANGYTPSCSFLPTLICVLHIYPSTALLPLASRHSHHSRHSPLSSLLHHCGAPVVVCRRGLRCGGCSSCTSKAPLQ